MGNKDNLLKNSERPFKRRLFYKKLSGFKTELVMLYLFRGDVQHTYMQHTYVRTLMAEACSWGIDEYPDSKVHGASMGPIWGRQDPGGPHVGPMNLAICEM